jgi:hypothetical protein
MKIKLTLTVEKEVVEKAKQQAASRDLSLSKIFESEIQVSRKLRSNLQQRDFYKDLKGRLQSKPLKSQTKN